MLDNSIHESTVGQLRSHTLQNNLENFWQVRKVDIKDAGSDGIWASLCE